MQSCFSGEATIFVSVFSDLPPRDDSVSDPEARRPSASAGHVCELSVGVVMGAVQVPKRHYNNLISNSSLRPVAESSRPDFGVLSQRNDSFDFVIGENMKNVSPSTVNDSAAGR